MIPLLEIFIIGLLIVITILGFITGIVTTFMGVVMITDSRERKEGFFLFIGGIIILSFYIGFGVYYGLIV